MGNRKLGAWLVAASTFLVIAAYAAPAAAAPAVAAPSHRFYSGEEALLYVALGVVLLAVSPPIIIGAQLYYAGKGEWFPKPRSRRAWNLIAWEMSVGTIYAVAGLITVAIATLSNDCETLCRRIAIPIGGSSALMGTWFITHGAISIFQVSRRSEPPVPAAPPESTPAEALVRSGRPGLSVAFSF